MLTRRFHVKRTELERSLTDYLGLMDIRLQAAEIALLIRHLELVLEANRRMNLTRVVEPEAALRLHTADSLSALEDTVTAPPGPLLDLGSGAGFPGIPLAVCSERSVVLLDSVGKKVRELRRMVSALGLQDLVTAKSGRAEALAREHSAPFSVITARAVSELPALVELASPLLSNGGILVCLKGSPSGEEVSRGDSVARIVGMQREYQRSFELPEQAGHRTVVCYRKIAGPKVKLPRREGLAQRAPLA
jgi:16S rRNA (guanine527-N7)-methyltransferase